MKFNCKSCGQGHFIPDERVTAGGDRGLRVRCSSCRAIMAVDKKLATMAGEETMPDLPTLRKRPAYGQGEESGGHAPELTDVRSYDDAQVPIPALLEGGELRPLPGVGRDVTGLHLSGRATSKTPAHARVWFAAIGGKPRGPYTEDEMRDLAARGKVRGRTRVWRPGFDDWMRVRTGEDERSELDWLRAVVVQRKRAERRAADQAREQFGVKTLTLESDSGPHRRAERTPPPLPSDAELDVGPVRAALAQPSLDEELWRAPLPVLPSITDAAFSPSEARAAYGQRRRTLRIGLMIGLWAGLAAVLGLYTLPTLGRLPTALSKALSEALWTALTGLIT